MTTLIIAEKPSVAQELARHLGHPRREDGYLVVGDYLVSWCFGHLLELAEPHVYEERWQKWRADDLPILPETAKVVPKSDKGTRKQLKVLGELLKRADQVIHAGDPDREGQLLVERVLQHYRNRKPVQRLWLAAQDSTSMRRAFAQLRDNRDYLPLLQAAETRAFADWLVGMNLSRAFTLAAQRHGYRGVVSIGRVQTPTLALIALRDQDIATFVSVTYYVPMLQVGVEAGSFWATWVAPPALKNRYPEGRITDQDYAESLLQVPDTGVISLLRKEHLKSAAPLPYRLSRLQKDASARFGMKADEVLDICQRLYETHKLTSYPRTDCDYLPVSQHADAPDILQALATIHPALQPWLQKADPQRRSAAWNDKKVTAHHAIIPVRGNGATFADLTTREQQIYNLIVQAWLAQFYPLYEYEKTTVEAEFGEHTFRATGNRPLVIGWKALYARSTPQESSEDAEAEQTLPAIVEGETAHKLASEARRKQTTPPKPYTDGTLIGDMESVHRVLAARAREVDDKWLKLLKENAGLGTEATRAGIIATLLDRGFISRQGKTLQATATGKALIAALPREVKSPIATAMLEQELAAIEQDGRDPASFLQQQRDSLTRLVTLARSHAVVLALPSNTPSTAATTTPKTRRKKSATASTRSDHTASNPTTPRKPRTRRQNTTDHEISSANTTAPLCRLCQKPMIRRQRQSDGQAFYGCSGYPACRHVENEVGTANSTPPPAKRRSPRKTTATSPYTLL